MWQRTWGARLSYQKGKCLSTKPTQPLLSNTLQKARKLFSPVIHQHLHSLCAEAQHSKPRFPSARRRTNSIVLKRSLIASDSCHRKWFGFLTNKVDWPMTEKGNVFNQNSFQTNQKKKISLWAKIIIMMFANLFNDEKSPLRTWVWETSKNKQKPQWLVWWWLLEDLSVSLSLSTAVCSRWVWLCMQADQGIGGGSSEHPQTS